MSTNSSDNINAQNTEALIDIPDSISAEKGKLKLLTGGYSSAGVKPQNEDAIGATGSPENSITNKGIVALVADGVSHAKAAAKASAFCISEFKKIYFKSPATWSTQHAISDTLSKINSALLNNSRYDKNQNKQQSNNDGHNHSQWLTTFSGIIFSSATAHIFHIGDTQILRVRKNQFQALTTPHNQKLGNNTNLLTRAMGADNHLKGV